MVEPILLYKLFIKVLFYEEFKWFLCILFKIYVYSIQYHYGKYPPYASQIGLKWWVLIAKNIFSHKKDFYGVGFGIKEVPTYLFYYTKLW